MGDHTVIRWTALSHDGWEAECACGKHLIGTDRRHAEERVRRHFEVETHMPGLRAALRGEER